MDSGNDVVGWDATATVSGELVVLERRLSRNADDVITTVEVTLQGDEAAEITVVDEIPAAWSVLEVGVHPDHVPRDFDADHSRIEFGDVVRPDEPLEVVYGVRVETTQGLEPPDPPVIDDERLEDDGDPAADPGAGFLSALDDGGSEGSVRREATAPEGSVRRETTDPRPDEREAASDEPLLRGSSSADTEDGSLWGSREASEPDTAAPQPPDRSETGRSDSFERARRIRELIESEHDLLEPRERDDGDEERPLVEALADELEADEGSEEALETLREALAPEGGGQRDSVRLNHLQSRVEEFAAYADTLGDAIDEHGALDEFLDAQVERIDAVEATDAEHEAELASLREAKEAAAAERETLEDRLAAMDDRIAALDDLTADVAAVEDELETLRRHHGDDVRDLEAAVDDLESTVRRRTAALGDEVESLEADLRRWNETRKHLVSVLDPTGDEPAGGA